MDVERTKAYVEENFEKCFVEPISGFIKIPNLTPAFDPEYYSNGLIQDAIQFVKEYAESMNIEGLEFHVHDEEGMPPMVVISIEGTGSPNVMIYGHLDKQPHMDGWREGTGPTTPTIIENKLYGRGSTDDGYVPFATLLAVKNAIEQGVELPRIVLVLETEEESGSSFLIPLLDKCIDWIKEPDYCICMDSGCLDYKKLWMTSSLRGTIGFNLKVSIAENALHSGVCGGAVPESFRVLNNLLNRLEDPDTYKMAAFEVDIPEKFLKEAEEVAALVGDDLYKDFHLLDGVKPINHDNLPEMYLNINWRPAIAVTGVDGMPPLEKSGNVVRAYTTTRIKMRLPPTADAKKALADATEILTQDPPHGAKVEILNPSSGNGWCVKDLKEGTEKALQDASLNFFGDSMGVYGIGGSIPFLNVLSQKYVNTEILALGAGGNDANIHAPNETLELPYAKKLICGLSHILHDIK